MTETISAEGTGYAKQTDTEQGIQSHFLLIFRYDGNIILADYRNGL
jgi:hypothetical protein